MQSGLTISITRKEKTAMWDQLQSELHVVLPEGGRVPPPTDQMLNELEAAIQVSLPASYREFVKRFGAGELAETFRIASCGYPEQANYWLANMIDLNAQCHLDDVQLQNCGELTVGQAKSLVYFCATTDGTVIGWLPSQVTDHGNHEYRIYIRMRDDKFFCMSDRFDQFINYICLGGGYDSKLKDAGHLVEEPTPSPKVFVPAAKQN